MKPYFDSPDATILHADVRDGLAQTMADESVHLVVTSPPYFGLRQYAGVQPSLWSGSASCEHKWGDWAEMHHEREATVTGKTRTTERYYGDESRRFNGNHQKHSAGSFCRLCGAWLGCLGLEPTPDLFVEHLVEVFRDVRRVLRSDGCLVLNLGDSYAGSGKGPQGKDGIGKADERQGFVGQSRRNKTDAPDGLKAKDLMEMPSRVALALQADGWWLRSRIAWVKRNCLPESVTDRPTTATEYVFLLAKSDRYYWDGEAVRRGSARDYDVVDSWDKRKAAGATGGCLDRGGNQQVAKGIGFSHNLGGETGRNYRNTDAYFDSLDLLIADQRRYLAHLEHIREDGGLLLDEQGQPMALDVCPQAYSEAHFATFPEALVRPFILAGTSERGVCGKCGKGWRRQTETGALVPTCRRGETSYTPVKVDGTGVVRFSKLNDSGHHPGNAYQTTTLGWRPACTCSAPTVPATVLDPFAGSGTTLLVARQLGRHSISIEASEEYCRLAVKRLEAQTPALGLLLLSDAEPEPEQQKMEV